MKKYFRYLGPILISAIFCLAIYLLYHKLKQYSIAEIRDSMQQVSSWRLLVSLLGTMVSYIILIGYDWLAIKAIHKSLALPRVCLVSFVGQAVSYNFGALLGGTTVRYRFYSAWDFTITDIVRLVLMLAVTFWVGVLGMCGIFFVLAPPHIPDALIEHIPFADLRILGFILFLVAFAYMVLCFRVRHPIHVFGKEFVFPEPHLAVMQFIVAGIDILAAAFCMYILLPGSLGITFWDFVPSYLLAQVAVVLTHVPGGVGIFELIIINLTHTDQTQVVFAAVLLFRLIYYILPLLLAALIFAAYEVRTRRSLFHEAKRWLRALSHSIAAYVTFGLGVWFLVASLMPVQATLFQNASSSLLSAFGHYLTGFAGCTLLFLSYGLEHKERMSYALSMAMCALGILGALMNGGGFITAGVGCLIGASIFVAKHRFYRKTFFLTSGMPNHWLFAALATLCLVCVAGLALYHAAIGLDTFLGVSPHINAARAMRSVLLFGFMAVSALVFLRERPREKERRKGRLR